MSRPTLDDRAVAVRQLAATWLARRPWPAGAQRMARRLSRVWPAKGTRELVRAGFVPLHVPAAYGWRRARHGEHVYRAWPDGSFTPVAVFRDVGVQDRDGRWRHRLVAGRPW